MPRWSQQTAFTKLIAPKWSRKERLQPRKPNSSNCVLVSLKNGFQYNSIDWMDRSILFFLLIRMQWGVL